MPHPCCIHGTRRRMQDLCLPHVCLISPCLMPAEAGCMLPLLNLKPKPESVQLLVPDHYHRRHHRHHRYRHHHHHRHHRRHRCHRHRHRQSVELQPAPAVSLTTASIAAAATTLPCKACGCCACTGYACARIVHSHCLDAVDVVLMSEIWCHS